MNRITDQWKKVFEDMQRAAEGALERVRDYAEGSKLEFHLQRAEIDGKRQPLHLIVPKDAVRYDEEGRVEWVRLPGKFIGFSGGTFAGDPPVAGKDYINEDKSHWVRVQGLLLMPMGRVGEDFKDGIYRVGEQMILLNPQSPHTPYVPPRPRELVMERLSVTSFLMQEDRKWRDKLLPARGSQGKDKALDTPDQEILP